MVLKYAWSIVTYGCIKVSTLAPCWRNLVKLDSNWVCIPLNQHQSSECSYSSVQLTNCWHSNLSLLFVASWSTAWLRRLRLQPKTWPKSLPCKYFGINFFKTIYKIDFLKIKNFRYIILQLNPIQMLPPMWPIYDGFPHYRKISLQGSLKYRMMVQMVIDSICWVCFPYLQQRNFPVHWSWFCW